MDEVQIIGAILLLAVIGVFLILWRATSSEEEFHEDE